VRRDGSISLAAVVMAVMVLAACGDGGRHAATATAMAAPTTRFAPTTTAALSTRTGVTPSTVAGLPTEQPTGAVEITPTAADLSPIGMAYATFVGFVACPVEPVPGELHAAVITATRVKWAFGQMQPMPGCMIVSNGAPPQGPYLAFPFGDVTDRGAVFTEQPDGTWRVNWFESDPFPCPADLTYPWQFTRRTPQSRRAARGPKCGRRAVVEVAQMQHGVGIRTRAPESRRRSAGTCGGLGVAPPFGPFRLHFRT